MKKLTDIQIQDNFNALVSAVESIQTTSDRQKKLLNLYTDYADMIALSPASGKESYHNCYPGGYVEHILNVLRIGELVHENWKASGAPETYTLSELQFSLIHHDLGKIGLGPKPYYIPNPSEWHRKNQGAIYTQNPDLDFMTVPDRGLFLLQSYNIECSLNEWLSIKLHDGLYEDGNKAYYMSYSDDGKLRTNLPYVIHEADMIASRIEWFDWKESKSITVTKDSSTVHGKSAIKNRMSALADKGVSDTASKLFDELFDKPL